MIAITLNFKSIEAARQALLDIPSSALVNGPAPEQPVQEAKQAPKAEKAAATVTSPATVEKAAAPEQTTRSPEVSTTTNSVAAGSANETAQTVEYSVLQKAVFALAGKSREAAAAVAASLGVKTFKELPADKWADALAAVNGKLAELEAA